MKSFTLSNLFTPLLIIILTITFIQLYYVEITRDKTNHKKLQEEYCQKVSHGNMTEYRMCKSDFYEYLNLNILRRELYMKNNKPKLYVY